MVNFLGFTLVLSLGLLSSLASGQIDDAIHVESKDPNDIQFLLYPNQAFLQIDFQVIQRLYALHYALYNLKVDLQKTVWKKTKVNNEDYDELIYNNAASVSTSRYNPTLPAIFLSHGFTQNKSSTFPVLVRNAYLEAGYPTTKANIIVVNWGKLSSAAGDFEIPVVSTLLDLPLYLDVLGNVPIVGKRLQEFITFLQSNGFLSGNVRLVGQSLGAHVSGYAGQFYLQATGSKIKRITGTDPASPGFQTSGIGQRLDSSDAEFVDIVHTNKGVFGYLGNLGHVDFYVNGGGPLQLSCVTSTDLFCSHNLATDYFAKSIVDSTIKACPNLALFCTSSNQIIFGEHTSTSASGAYNVNLSV